MRFPALPAQTVQYGRGDKRIEFVEAIEGQHRDLHAKTPAKMRDQKARAYTAPSKISSTRRDRAASADSDQRSAIVRCATATMSFSRSRSSAHATSPFPSTLARSEDGRAGQECVSWCRSRGS